MKLNNWFKILLGLRTGQSYQSRAKIGRLTVEDISQISPFPALLSQFLSETSFSLARTIPSFVSLFLGNMLSLSFLVLPVLLPWSVTYLPLSSRRGKRNRPNSTVQSVYTWTKGGFDRRKNKWPFKDPCAKGSQRSSNCLNLDIPVLT